VFAFDPAHNILSDHNSPTIPDNRLKIYNGTTYYYDDLGNLIHRELADGEVQNYFYDLHDQLVKAEIFKKDGSKETWAYSYDALGRRIGKGRLKNEEVSGSLEEETRFVWDGSHLLQEIHPDGRYTYIYADQNSYEPLAQVRDWTTEDGENRHQTHYFHCDQIGIPREMTDKDGNLLWFGNYTGWGRLKEETKVTDNAYQPFRLQNQYADRETGLHYNFFRYYEPDAGRFVSQDPIGLKGGDNFYQFAPSTQNWFDPTGLTPSITVVDPLGLPNRRQAFNLAKDLAGIPRSQQPDRQWTVGNDVTRRGMANYEFDPNPGRHGRYYEFTDARGHKKVVVEHTNDGNRRYKKNDKDKNSGKPCKHFHAGQAKDNPRTYDFKKDRYKKIDREIKEGVLDHHIDYI